MALPFSEDWTGTNGDPWDDPPWTTEVSGAGGVVDIQSNEGRFLLDTAGSYTAWCRALLDDQAAADFDLTVDFIIAAQGPEYYPIVAFRMDGGWSGAFPTNGYIVQLRLKTDTAWGVERVDAGSRTVLDGPTVITATTGDVIHVNVLCDGSAVEVRIWVNAEAKPGTASFAFTDSTYPTQTRHGLNVEGGGAGSADSMTWDNLAIDSLVTTVEGTATGAFNFTGPVSGAVTVEGVATSAFEFTGSASGTATVEGTATAALGFTATASGETFSEVTGQAATPVTFTAAATGTASTPGTAATPVTFTAPAVGVVTVLGEAATNLTFAATAAGDVAVSGEAVTSLTFAAPAVGTPSISGQAATNPTFTAPAVGVVEQFATAATALTFAAPAVGEGAAQQITGTAATTLAFAAQAAGTVTVSGQAATSLTFIAPAVGTATGVVVGTAATDLTFAAVVVVSAVVYARATSHLRPAVATTARRKASVQ